MLDSLVKKLYYHYLSYNTGYNLMYKQGYNYHRAL